MKALALTATGSPDNFQMIERDPTPLKPGYVQVRVHATSVNPVDCKIRSLGLPFGPDLPGVLHGDVAGVVEAVGDGVTAFNVGDRVYGCAGGVKGEDGALAELMACDADLLSPLPDGLDFAEGAALALVAITAWEGLVDKAQVRPNQKVLIHAGAGGVGHVAVQLAKAKGCEVYATVSGPDKAALVEGLGATPINYREADVDAYVALHTGGAGFDVVYDTVGGDNIPLCWQAARTNGTVISCQTNSTHDLTPLHIKGLTHIGVLMLIPLLSGNGRAHHGLILREIASLAEAGKMRPILDPVPFTLETAADAHRHWEARDHVGKIAIRVQA
ncbi:MAG: zinc-dependent alcohol dehydrogenase family protein [Rhodospirillaceae bacterium]